MKKYLILAAVLVALAAVCLFFSWESATSAGNPLAFYGTATNGATVTAFKQPGNTPYYSDVAQFENYQIYIPSDQTGIYLISDNCQTFYRYWNGSQSVQVDICVYRPGEQDCDCF